MNILSFPISTALAAPAAARALSDKVDRAENLFNSNPQSFSDMSDINRYLTYLSGISAQNSALSQSYAREQMDFQREQNALAMAFNAAEAAKNRSWQTEMSNSAHVREMADLQAAGLNPVLAANNGAAVTSGATASGVTSAGASGTVDSSVNAASAAIVGQILNALTQQANMRVSAETSYRIAQLQSDTSKFLGALSAETSRYGSEMSYRGTRYSADSSYASAVKTAGIAANTAEFVARLNNISQDIRQDDSQAHDLYMAENYPNSLYGTVNSLLNDFLDGNGRVGKFLDKFADMFGKTSSSGARHSNKRSVDEIFDNVVNNAPLFYGIF